MKSGLCRLKGGLRSCHTENKRCVGAEILTNKGKWIIIMFSLEISVKLRENRNHDKKNGEKCLNCQDNSEKNNS